MCPRHSLSRARASGARHRSQRSHDSPCTLRQQLRHIVARRNLAKHQQVCAVPQHRRQNGAARQCRVRVQAVDTLRGHIHAAAGGDRIHERRARDSGLAQAIDEGAAHIGTRAAYQNNAGLCGNEFAFARFQAAGDTCKVSSVNASCLVM